MKIKSISIFGIFLFALFLFSSCQTKEERVINKFESLAKHIDKNSESFSDEDWEEILVEYKALHEEALECEFTSEQLRDFGRVDGLLTAVITREGSKKLGRDFGRYMNEGKQVIKGFIEGFTQGISSEDE